MTSLKKYVLKYIGWLIPILIVLGACENNLETVKGLTELENKPDVVATDMEVLYSDSARVKGKVVTPEFKSYAATSNAEGYSEYPKGVHVYLYNDSLKVIAEVSAKYAIYHDKTKLWEARNDVQVLNTKGEHLNTEQLFWDMNSKKLYSHKYSKVSFPDGTYQIGQRGVETSEDFTTSYTFFGYNGTMLFDDAK